MKKSDRAAHPPPNLITLNSKDTSNKNININICYNLTQSANVSNSSTPIQTPKLKCKKIDNKQVIKMVMPHHFPPSKISFAKPKVSNKIAPQSCKANNKTIIDDECLISVNINSHKYTLINPTLSSLPVSRKNSIQGQPRLAKLSEYFPSRQMSPNTPACSSSKSNPKKVKHNKIVKNRTETGLRGNPLPEEKPARSETKKSKTHRLKSPNKMYTEVTTNRLLKKLNKTLDAFQSTRNTRPSTGHTLVTSTEYHKSKSPMQSKQTLKCSSRDKVKNQNTTNTITNLIKKRVIRFSQLSCGQSEMHEQMLSKQQQQHASQQQQGAISTINEAVEIIKKHWKQFKRKQVQRLYQGLFNTKLTNLVSREYISEGETSQFRSVPPFDIEALGFVPSFQNFERPPPAPSKALTPNLLIHANQLNFEHFRLPTNSEQIEQDDSRFNTNKYMNSEDQEIDTLEQNLQKHLTLNSSSSPDDKEQQQDHLAAQIEQWNKISDLLAQNINNPNASQDFDHILSQIIEQGQNNQKWIEENCKKPFSASSSKKRPLSVSPQQRIQTLITEQDIAEKAFKSIKDPLIEQTRLANINHKKSKSSCSLDKCDVVEPPLEKSGEPDTIEGYLDCKLNEFQFRNNNSSISEENIAVPAKDSQQVTKGGRTHDIHQIRNQQEEHYHGDEINLLLQKLRLNSASDSAGDTPRSSGLGEMCDIIKPPQNIDNSPGSDSIQPSKEIQFYDAEKKAIVVDHVLQNLILDFCVYIRSSPHFLNRLLGCHQKEPALLEPMEQQLNDNKYFSIKTGFHAVKEYLQGLISFFMSKPEIIKTVISNSNKSLGPTSREFLFYLRPNNDDCSYELSDFSQSADLLVVPMEVYEEYESILAQNPAYHVSSNTSNLNYYLHRAFFQGFNDAFEYQRPYSNYNPPFSWTKTKRLPRPASTPSNIHTRVRETLQLVLEWCSYPRGFIFDKPDSIFVTAHLREDQKRKINEQRLALVLGEDLLEQEKEILDYQQEESEVRVDLSYSITDQMFYEVVIELKKLLRNRRSLLF